MVKKTEKIEGIKYNRKARFVAKDSDLTEAPVLKKVTIHVAGVVTRNGAGGIGAIVRYETHCRAVQEGYKTTTKNRMDILAAIRGLDQLKRKCDVTLFTTNNYLVETMKQWVKGWQERGWKKANGEKVPDADLWQQLAAAASGHRVTFRYLKNTKGKVDHELCLMTAQSAAESPRMVDRLHDAILANDK
ncbi:TPA: ribonuclease HI [Klebsiella oxytoca]|nr:ribonuclease HI [Klebsiella oxytoca]HBL6911825.1 ribonuclease HI [Klebsiella oxytoca]